VHKIRDLFKPLEKLAIQSNRHFKDACCHIIGITNQLSSMKVGNYSFVKPNTLEKSRGRKRKDLFSNNYVSAIPKEHQSTPPAPKRLVVLA
jgi:hypothetical protein